MNGEPDGPWVSMAIFCEKALEEKDGVFSAIRIVDQIVQTASGPEPPDRMPPLEINLVAFLLLRPGSLRGHYNLTLRASTPAGTELASTPFSIPILFPRDDAGINLRVNVFLKLDQEGVYWFNVLFGDRLLTRMPLRVMYRRELVPK